MSNELLPFVLIGVLLIVLIGVLARLVWLIAGQHRAQRIKPTHKLIVLEGQHKGRAFPIDRSPFYIGRDASCAIRLTDEPTVSRRHARIELDQGKPVLVDQSTNGVYLDGQRIFQKPLVPGDRFQIGRSLFVVAGSNGAVPPQPPATSVNAAKEALRRSTLAQRYELVEQIGKGGFMTVYRATDRRTGQTVALKVLRVESGSQAQYIRHKMRDWLYYGLALSHPHCVRLLDGDADGDEAYLVEEFIPGKKLSERMLHLVDTEARVRVIGEICDGLYFLHRNGIIHRDLSPNNVMFDEAGRCKLIDFGLARYENRPTVTQHGAWIGTPTYFSPEHAKRDPRLLCPQSDLYSLGVIAFHLFTGRPPFISKQGDIERIAEDHIRTPPPRPSMLAANIPPHIERAILRALNKRPEDRFANAREMAEAFGYTQPFHEGSANHQSVQRAFAGSLFSGPLRLRRPNGSILLIDPPQEPINRALINPNDSAISRREHGKFVCQQDGFWRIEPPTAKGALVFINGVLLDEPTLLSPGDRIRVGQTELIVLPSR
ncbi:MAG: protein kinase [Thermoflexales bacterium]|nr:protein kinase [Thermoflexales bacterium]